MKLFCIPYAGGSAAYYTKWKKHLHSSIKLCPLELASRGRRYGEPLYKDLNDVIEDLYQQIQLELKNNEPYALFGHSMGSLLAYELGVKIKEMYGEPVHYFASAGVAPHARKKSFRHKLPQEEFINLMLNYEGTPKKFFQYKELIELYIPTLRNDVRLVEEYDFDKGRLIQQFNCPVTALYGNEDKLIPAYIVEEWRKITSNELKVITFEGGHFFIHDNIKSIVDLINKTLIVI